jgi:hypothetical protein
MQGIRRWMHALAILTYGDRGGKAQRAVGVSSYVLEPLSGTFHRRGGGRGAALVRRTSR